MKHGTQSRSPVLGRWILGRSRWQWAQVREDCVFDEEGASSASVVGAGSAVDSASAVVGDMAGLWRWGGGDGRRDGATGCGGARCGVFILRYLMHAQRQPRLNSGPSYCYVWLSHSAGTTCEFQKGSHVIKIFPPSVPPHWPQNLQANSTAR